MADLLYHTCCTTVWYVNTPTASAGDGMPHPESPLPLSFGPSSPSSCEAPWADPGHQCQHGVSHYGVSYASTYPVRKRAAFDRLKKESRLKPWLQLAVVVRLT